MALVALLAWLAIEMPLDWLLALHVTVRAAILVCGVGGAVALAWIFGFRPWLHRPDDDRVALAIERALPQFRSRLIASVQLSREHDAPDPDGTRENMSRALVDALLAETRGIAADAPFDDVVKTDTLRRWVRITVVATLLAAALWFGGGRASWPLFQRALLMNVAVPRKTMIVAFTGPRVIAIGDDLRIEATAAGVIPKSGKLVVESGNGRRQEFSFDTTPAEPVRFARTLHSVQEDFRYRIELGDNRTETENVRVRHRPAIASIAYEQQWPAYTKLAPVQRQPGNLKLLAGSKLSVRLTATSPLRDATLRLTGAEPTKVIHAAPLVANDAGEWSGTAEIPAKDVAGVTFQLTDSEGVVSRAMAVPHRDRARHRADDPHRAARAPRGIAHAEGHAAARLRGEGRLRRRARAATLRGELDRRRTAQDRGTRSRRRKAEGARAALRVENRAPHAAARGERHD